MVKERRRPVVRFRDMTKDLSPEGAVDDRDSESEEESDEESMNSDTEAEIMGESEFVIDKDIDLDADILRDFLSEVEKVSVANKVQSTSQKTSETMGGVPKIVDWAW